MKNFVLLLSLFLFAVLPITLPSCKAGQASPVQDYFFDVGKAFTKANLQVLFPDAHFEKDSVQASKVFEQARLRQIFRLKVREFLTKEGSVTLDKADFKGAVKWERTGEQVRISVTTKNKSPRDSL